MMREYRKGITLSLGLSFMALVVSASAQQETPSYGDLLKAVEERGQTQSAPATQPTAAPTPESTADSTAPGAAAAEPTQPPIAPSPTTPQTVDAVTNTSADTTAAATEQPNIEDVLPTPQSQPTTQNAAPASAPTIAAPSTEPTAPTEPTETSVAANPDAAAATSESAEATLADQPAPPAAATALDPAPTPTPELTQPATPPVHIEALEVADPAPLTPSTPAIPTTASVELPSGVSSNPLANIPISRLDQLQIDLAREQAVLAQLESVLMSVDKLGQYSPSIITALMDSNTAIDHRVLTAILTSSGALHSLPASLSSSSQLASASAATGTSRPNSSHLRFVRLPDRTQRGQIYLIIDGRGIHLTVGQSFQLGGISYQFDSIVVDSGNKSLIYLTTSNNDKLVLSWLL